MAVFNNIRIKNNIKSKSANVKSKGMKMATNSASWLKNATTSLGVSLKETGSEMMPSTFDSIRNVTTEFSTMYSFLRDYKSSGGVDNLTNAFNNNEYTNIIRTAFANAKADLKSGNINNKDREMEAFLGGDDTISDDEFSYDGEFDSSLDEESGDGISFGGDVDSDAIAETFVAQTEAMSNGLKGVAEVNYAMGRTQLQVSKESYIQVGQGLKAINENLALLVNYNNDVMTVYTQTSMKYYDDHMGAVKQQLEIQQKLMAPNAPPNEYKENPEEDLLYGGLSLEKIGNVIKSNITEYSNSNMMISMGKMALGSPDMLKSLAANPVGFITQSLISSTIPKVLKETLGAIDNSITNFVPALMMKFNRDKSNYSNPLMQMLGSILGIKTQVKKSIDLTKYNNGPTPFDGETKKSIVEVIPSYLRKILAAITGQEERIFDHNTNTFRTINEVKDDFDKAKKSAAVYEYSDSIDTIMDKASFLDYSQRSAFKGKLEDFMLNLSDSDKLLDVFGLIGNGSGLNLSVKNDKINKYMDKALKTDETKEEKEKRIKREQTSSQDFDSIAKKANMSESESTLLMEIIRSMNKGDVMKLFGRDVLSARSSMNDFMERLEKDPNRFLASSIMGEGKLPFNEHLNDKGEMKKGFGAFSPIDSFGNNSLDYLRNIQQILVDGIKVFMSGESTGDPTHLNKYLMKNVPTEEVKKSSTSEEEFKMTQEEIVSGITTVDEKKKEEKAEQKTWLSKVVDNIIGKSTNETTRDRLTSVKDFFNKPMNIIQNMAKKLDDTMFKLVFGKDDQEDLIDPETGEIKRGTSFISSVGVSIANFFDNTHKWAIAHIYEPLKESLFGKEGIITQIKDSKLYEVGKEKWEQGKNYILGEKDEEGNRQNGIGSRVYNETKDIIKGMAHYFTGNSYTKADGTIVPDNDKAVFSEVKKVFVSVSDSIKTKWFGNKDEDGNYKEEEKGIITRGLDSIHKGFLDFGKLIFGNKFGTDQDINGAAFAKNFKEGLPKSLAWGGIGAALSIASPLGFMGSLFLPGGIVGGAMVGMASGFLSQSESFKTWLFGPQDPNDMNNRLGGIISSSTQNFLKQNKIHIAAGAGLGALKGMIFGGGALTSMFIGGPIGGALMGIGTAMIGRSEVFQRFMFGDLDENGNRAGGILSKLKFNFKSGKKEDNAGGRMVAGMLGGSALGAITSQFGLLGSVLTLGSGPLFGAVAGAATGIALSSKKFTKLMFGEIDEVTGKRNGGIVTKTLNKMTVSLLGPVKDAFDGLKIKAGEWFTDKILLPIQVAMDPIIAQFKFLGDAIKDIFSKTMNTLNTFIKDTVVTPIGTTLKMILNPIGKMLKAGLGMGVKLGANIAATPFSILESVAGFAQGRHEKRGIKKYKESIDEDYRETRNAKKFEKGKLDEEEWRKKVQKNKGLMSDEDWTEYKEKYEGMDKPSKLGSIRAKYFDRNARKEAMYGEEGAQYAEGKTFDERLKDIRAKNLSFFDEKRKKLEEQKAQTDMRRQYAETYGYDNTDGKGNDKSFIYDANTYFKKNEETGQIEAWRDEAKTQQAKDTEDIKFNTDKLVEYVEKNTEATKETAKAITAKDNTSGEAKTFAEKATDVIRNNTGTMIDKLYDVEHWLKVMAGKADEDSDPPSEEKKSTTRETGEKKQPTEKENEAKKELSSVLPTTPSTNTTPSSSTTGAKANIPALPSSTGTKPASTSLVPALPTGITVDTNRLKKASPKKSMHDGKNVLEYQKEQEELKQKESAANFSNVMMDSIVAMRDNDKKFHFEWSSIFGKKGLITAAILAGVPLLMKLLGWITDKLKNGSVDIEGSINGGSFANDPGGPNEGVWVNPDGTVTPIYNTQLRENIGQALVKLGLKGIDNIPASIKKGLFKGAQMTASGAKKVATGVKNIAKKTTDYLSNTKAGKFFTENIYNPVKNTINSGVGVVKNGIGAIKSGIGAVSERFAQNVSGSRIPGVMTGEILSSTDNADRWLLNGTVSAASSASDDVIDVAYREVTTNNGLLKNITTGANSMVKKFGDIILAAFDAITTNKTFIKYLNKSTACITALKGVVQKVLKIASKYTTKITKAVTKFTATTAAEIGTGGVAALVFGVYDLLTGATKSEAANLFQVGQDDVDVLMRGISSAVKVLLGLGNLGPIADIFSEMFAAVTGFNMKTWCASTFYSILSGDSESLNLAQEAFTKEYQQAIEESGNLNTTKEEYNNMVNKTWWSKYISDPISKATDWNDESVQKKFMDREDFDVKTSKIKFTDRLASAAGNVVSLIAFGNENVDKYVSNKLKSGFDFMKNAFTPKQRNAQGQAYNQAKLSELKQTIDEWNSMDCLSEETRLSMADEEYWVVVYNYMSQMGYESPSQMTEEDMINAFGDYSQGELPDTLKRKYGLDQYNQPGYKWTLNDQTGEIEVHDIYSVDLPSDGSIKINDQTGMLEINYDNVPVIEGWKGRSLWGNIKHLGANIGKIGSSLIKGGINFLSKIDEKYLGGFGGKVVSSIGGIVGMFIPKERNAQGQAYKKGILTELNQTIDEWNSMDSISEETRLTLANEEYNLMIQNYIMQVGYQSMNEITEEDMVKIFGEYTQGELPDVLKQKYGLDQYNQPGYKWTLNAETGEIEVHDIANVTLPEDGSIKINTETGMLEIDYDKVPVVEGWKGRSFWGNIKHAGSKLFQAGANFLKDPSGSIKEGISSIGTAVSSTMDAISGGMNSFDDKYLNGNGKKALSWAAEKAEKAKESISTMIGDTTEKAKELWGNIQSGVDEATDNSIFGGLKDDNVRETLGLKEGTEIGFKDRFSVSIAGFIDGLTGGKVEKESSSKVIYGMVEMAQEKAVEFWGNFKSDFDDWAEDTKKKFKEGMTKADMFFGNVFGFTDENGDPMTLSQKTKEVTDKFSDGVKTIVNNVKNFSFDDFWTNFKQDTSVFMEEAKVNFKTGMQKSDKFFGNVFGFTDENGEPMTLSAKSKELTDTFSDNMKTLVNNVKSFSFDDFWTNFKQDASNFMDESKENIKSGIQKSDMFLGNVFGFTDENGNPMKLSTKVSEQVDKFTDNAKTITTNIKTASKNFWDESSKKVQDNVKVFTDNFKEGTKKLDMFFGNVFGFVDDNGNPISLSAKLGQKVDEYQGVMTSFTNKVKERTKEAFDKFNTKVGEIADAIKDIPGKIDEALGSWFSGEKDKKLTTLVKEKLNVVGSFFSNLIGSVKSFFGVATDKANSSVNSRNTGSGSSTIEELLYDKAISMTGSGNVTNNITNARYVTGAGCPNVNNTTNNINNVMGKGPDSTTATGMKISGKFGIEDKVHNFAYNAQSDPRWASYNYGLSPGVSGSTSNPTMAARACGPTAFSMVASQLNGQNYSPVEMADKFRQSGHSLPGGTTGAAMVDMAKKYGINGRYDSTTSAGIRNAITSNKPMILLGNRKSSDISSSPFTSGGHFVTAVGIAGNKVLINDPRGKNYSKAYDLNKVASETRGSWSYTGGNPTILPNSEYGDFSNDVLNKGSQAYKLKHKSDTEKVKIYEDLGWNEFTNFLNSKSITEPNDPILYKIDSTQYSGSGEGSTSNYSSARMRAVQDAMNGLKNDGYLAAYSSLYGNNDALVSLSNLDDKSFKNTIDEFRSMSNDEYKETYGVKLDPTQLLAGNGTATYARMGKPNIRTSGKHLMGLGPDYESLTGLGPSGSDIVASARKLIGKPYVYGGNVSPLGSSNGTDCSGLCQWAYNDNGTKISRTTYTQINEGREVKKENLLPGDLVFSNWDGKNFQHVTLYAGNNKVIEAQKTGTTISERNLNWTSSSRARRILSDEAAAAGTGSSASANASSDSSSIATTTTEAVSSDPTLFQKLTTAVSQVFSGVTNKLVYGSDYEGLDWDVINGISYVTKTEANNIEGSTNGSDGSTSYGDDDTGKLLGNFHNLSGIFEVGGQSPSSISSFNEKSGYISNGASWGDAGGNSYGLPQFTIPTGSLKGFVNWLQTAHPDMGSKLSGKTLGSTSFNSAWKGLASEPFKLAQWEYTDRNFFTPGLTSAQNKGVQNTDTITMKSVINSNAKAKGTADSMFGRIMKAGANKNLQPAITAMYQNVKDNTAKDYRSSAASVQQSWKNRADKEKNFALEMAKREAPGKGGDDINDFINVNREGLERSYNKTGESYGLGSTETPSLARFGKIEGSGNVNDSKLKASPIVGKGADLFNKFISKNRYNLEKASKETGLQMGMGEEYTTPNITSINKPSTSNVTTNNTNDYNTQSNSSSVDKSSVINKIITNVKSLVTNNKTDNKSTLNSSSNNISSNLNKYNNLNTSTTDKVITNNNETISSSVDKSSVMNKIISDAKSLITNNKSTTSNNTVNNDTDNTISLKEPNMVSLYNDSKDYVSPVSTFVDSLDKSTDLYSTSLVDKEISLSSPSATTSNVRTVLMSNNTANNNMEELVVKAIQLLSGIADNTSNTVSAINEQELQVNVQQPESSTTVVGNGGINVVAPGNTNVNNTTQKDKSANRNLERATAIARGRF